LLRGASLLVRGDYYPVVRAGAEAKARPTDAPIAAAAHSVASSHATRHWAVVLAIILAGLAGDVTAAADLDTWRLTVDGFGTVGAGYHNDRDLEFLRGS